MTDNNYTLYTSQIILFKKVLDGFSREEYERGEEPQEVHLLSHIAHYWLQTLQNLGSTPDARLSCLQRQVTSLQIESYSYWNSPKPDLFTYLRSFYDFRDSLLEIGSTLNLI
ncbi:hypothetical protein [Rufibacter immobilis]|uniref:hypothetical protein n=1 Tax=Rufibacter immobilis TaxID=1348778 RepID=UPI0035E52014